jgi:hypothetical protein
MATFLRVTVLSLISNISIGTSDANVRTSKSAIKTVTSNPDSNGKPYSNFVTNIGKPVKLQKCTGEQCERHSYKKG